MMTTAETKPPIKDEVERVLLWMEAGEMSLWGEKQANSQTLRAYIAAQGDKIADLEAKLSDASMDYYNQQQGKEKLEAENKRLLEALQFYADHDWEDAERFNQDARPKPHDLSLPARAALAQTDEPAKS